ncbi:protein-disulfide reductase DsbD N-terminal domain-containing protein [Pedobacter sp. CFBP9032]|uniref:protein-disulfide reductase DsbD N-terminal domain-containing protein n=1 Tax=Pedobacter sp. CFBP9032 TaxID=3096539 RepID=UPI002A6AB44B|nr:protein-disulfide reductase DsbD domain-containing protein [Pedobacter sp. CFBP9032]MDY0903291.1 protein-disulfide reductase DsbD family protein [Pedobacter sp. CFBP9032]
MKKAIILFFVIGLMSLSASSQILKPITWSYAAKRTSATTATLYIKATIDDGWHLYSQFVKAGGPVKTTFTFPAAAGYTLVGKTIEPKPVVKYEDTFKMNVSYFEHSVIFQQKIKLTGKSALVKGTVESMVCNDKQCLPPEEIAFSIAVK